MLPENQPYYWPPHNPVQLEDPPAAAILQPQDIFPAHHDANKIIPFLGGGCPNIPDTGMQYLSNWPISFGNFPLGSMVTPSSVHSLYNSDLTAAAWSLSRFDWAVHGFNSGHFISSICSLGLPFAIVLASDDYVHSPSLFTGYPPALAQFLVGVVLFWTMSKQAESHQNYLATLFILSAPPIPTNQLSSYLWAPFN
jgi:hypothetical protein